jgi:phospholipase C
MFPTSRLLSLVCSFLCLLIMVTLLFGCGGAGGASNAFGNGPAPSPGPSPAPAPAPAPPPSSSPSPPPSAAPTVSITANPAAVVSGQASVLTVTSANATGVVVTNDQDSTTFPLPSSGGTVTVNPKVTTTYTAVATGSNGQSASATTAVTVSAPTPTVSITANPAAIVSGQASTLTVSATNAASVVVSNDQNSTTFSLPPGGGTGAVNPAVTTTYTAVATGADGHTATATVQVTVSPGIGAVNHVLIMFQENRSFDEYFWKMTDYRQRNGIAINSSDGKIRDGSSASAKWLTSNISPATGHAVMPYHTGSVCTEDLTPDWAESHKEMDVNNPAAAGPGSPMNGFVSVAFGLSQFYGVLADQDGHRAMGYFDDTDFPYYYFIASNFAIGDMFFSPVPSRTSANRLYIHAATSQGKVHPDTTVVTQLTAKTIWRELDDAGISWKIYISDWGINNFTFLQFFTDFNSRAAHVVSIDQYFTDVSQGTLPAVAFIETGMHTGRDEHPTNNPGPGQPVPTSLAINVQAGAFWTAKIINALMDSPASWKDSVFFWTFDEGGGAMEHVPPISVPSPDGIKPNDFDTTKDCFNQPCSNFDFNITGFRVPNFIVSPFAKKNYVSHTPMDYTAILKFIETRWNLTPLTKRDAAMPDMTEFFDFAGAPWATPPSASTRPPQPINGACDFTKE